MESLAFAVRVASLTPKEHKVRREIIDESSQREDIAPVVKLTILMAEDQRLRNEDNNEFFSEDESAMSNDGPMCIKTMKRTHANTILG